MRVGLSCAATSLARTFTWSTYVFGAFVVYTGLGAWRPAPPAALDRLPNFLWRIGRLARGDHGGRFLIDHAGRRAFTPLAGCLLSMMLFEVLFALDSVALLSVSTTTFVIV